MTIRLYRAFEEDLGVTRSRLTSFAKTAPKRYKVYTIPKRSSGYRVIAHPSKALKKIQKFLVEFLSDFFISHPNSFAYKKGVGIKDNASMHIGTKYLLKMDFSNFFNSISFDLLVLACKQNEIKVSSAELKLLENLIFWNKTKTIQGSQNLVLSVGAPTSPLVSNFVMYKFDVLISEYCNKHKINYSRYADDITFSTNKKNNLFQVTRLVKDILSKYYDNKITVNNIKTVFSSKAHNRHVTGITITNDDKLSVGRERKRLISTLIHKYTIESINIDDTLYLQGLLSFAIHVEPDFKMKMSKKYGYEVINKILKLRAENDQ